MTVSDGRSTCARAEERRLGPASEPLVQAAVLNQWNGGPAAALRDVAALRRRAEAAADGMFWQLRPRSGKRRSSPR